MPPSGSRYPVVLQAVLNHAERMVELLAQRERVTRDWDAGGVWLIGRATELQCVAAMVAVDWQEGRLPADAAAGKLARHLRELHDGMAMHLDIAMPACCPTFLAATPGRAGSRAGRPVAAKSNPGSPQPKGGAKANL